MRFADSSVIVTGAGSGVGRAAARRFAEEGARVTCVDLRKAWALDTVEQISADGGTAQAVECDVSDESSVEAAIASTVAAYGRLDVMINNVGISTPRNGMKLEDHTTEDFDKLVAVNFRGVFNGMKHAIIRFKQQGDGGAIVSTGSAAGLVGWGGAVYGATKGAIHQLTRTAAIEGAPFKIRVNAICPGAMPGTSFLTTDPQHGDAGVPDDVAAAVSQVHPLGDAITAGDCAEALLFLSSPGAANITGVCLPVDGGYVAR
ncbi:MAG: SDR family NAD(P)-dependent oxidoreductase [Ilumatobacteraceae bacterium]